MRIIPLANGYWPINNDYLSMRSLYCLFAIKLVRSLCLWAFSVCRRVFCVRVSSGNANVCQRKFSMSTIVRQSNFVNRKSVYSVDWFCHPSQLNDSEFNRHSRSQSVRKWLYHLDYLIFDEHNSHIQPDSIDILQFQTHGNMREWWKCVSFRLNAFKLWLNRIINAINRQKSKLYIYFMS